MSGTESESDETPFVPALALRDNPERYEPIINTKATCVEYADGTSALAIYPAGDGDDFATAEWVSALGDSFVSLEAER